MDSIQVLNITVACLLLSSTLRNNQFIDYFRQKSFDSFGVLLNQINGKPDDFNDDDDDDEMLSDDAICKDDTDQLEDYVDADEDNNDDASSNNMLTEMAVKLFFVYTNCLHKTYKLCDSVYRYHPASKMTIDVFYYAAQCVSGYYMDYRVEPFSKNWVSVLVHTRHMFSEINNIYYPDRPLHTTQLDEYIEPIYDTTNSLLQLATFAKSIRDVRPVMQTANKTPKFIDAMLFCYYDNHYISKIIKTNIPSHQIDVDTNAPRSRVSFLSIKYIHPDQSADIPIDLPRSMFYAGNEILSSAFIKRYLEYNQTDYIMNEEYKIQIMDNMLQTFLLDKTQYILLKERNYTVMTV